MPVQLEGAKDTRRGKLHRYNVEHPSNVRFDILGPLPRTASAVISTYLLSWTTSRNGPKCTPFRDQEAPTVAEAVVQHWISRYGVPLQLHWIREEISSAVLKGVWGTTRIDKTKTTPLHPQSDGMVERFNRTILNNLSLMVSKNQQDWDQKVPLFLASRTQRVRSRDYRIFTIPDAFWPRSSPPL
ncbi:retrovirus-related Pol polyprotein from transposon 412 [Trichonephila clavipes]|nr:retrovirus-related Pol polyprotein from transposon 412 [Trichonephila clavipes]